MNFPSERTGTLLYLKEAPKSLSLTFLLLVESTPSTLKVGDDRFTKSKKSKMIFFFFLFLKCLLG